MNFLQNGFKANIIDDASMVKLGSVNIKIIKKSENLRLMNLKSDSIDSSSSSSSKSNIQTKLSLLDRTKSNIDNINKPNEFITIKPSFSTNESTSSSSSTSLACLSLNVELNYIENSRLIEIKGQLV